MAAQDPEIVRTITDMARRHGIDPATALAIAERESSLNPSSRAGTSSAYGLFQLTQANRDKYGGSSQDPAEQAEAWGKFIQGTKREMQGVLGREPTGSELYSGHFFGGTRAARMLSKYDQDTPVASVFTPRELAANPLIGRAGTTGALTNSVMGDIDRRQKKFAGIVGAPPGTPEASADPQGGAAIAPPAGPRGPAQDMDFSSMAVPDFSGEAADEAPDFSSMAESA